MSLERELTVAETANRLLFAMPKDIEDCEECAGNGVIEGRLSTYVCDACDGAGYFEKEQDDE